MHKFNVKAGTPFWNVGITQLKYGDTMLEYWRNDDPTVIAAIDTGTSFMTIP